MNAMQKWIGGGFIVGAIFWAGVTYNQISEIKTQLVEIRQALPDPARVAVIETRMDFFERRLEAVERAKQ